MKIQIQFINRVRKHFSGSTFDVQYYLDGAPVSEEGMTLDHKNFEKFTKLEEVIEIPDGKFNSLQEAIEWYLEENI